ncbi:AAA family ATPase [Candidatus Uhrbacteria bacterium]|nr:AAA family ATPase [Candidatus Uhrbacteria bacterium]
MSAEIERRFVIESIDPDFHRRAFKRIRIEQGYYSTMPGTSLRIRIKDGMSAVITHKRGNGLVREEIEGTLPFETARAQLEHACDYRIFKTRHLVDRWEIDEFHGPLSGLWIAEIELRSHDEPLPEFPRWITSVKEVTDSVNNLALAELASFIEGRELDRPVREYLRSPVPIAVLTGGPGSGKSTAMEALKQEFGDRIVFLPEMATLVMQQVGFKPPPADDIVGQAHFQRMIFGAQRVFEHGAQSEALLQGKKLVLADRGTLDNAAYLPDGLKDLARICGIVPDEEVRRYRQIIWLDSPPKEVYEQIKGNNPVRRETYEEADALGTRILHCWRSPLLVEVFGQSWDGKLAHVRKLVSDLLRD